MSFFQLPNIPINNEIDKIINFNVKNFQNNNTPFINKTLYSYLSLIKTHINNNRIEYNKLIKLSNPYEYIYTDIPNIKSPVCKYVPSSKYFFKYIEMINMLDLFNGLPFNSKILNFSKYKNNGFIEAINYLRQNKKDISYSISYNDYIINDNSIEIKSPNIIIENIYNKSNNIIDIENLNYFYKKYNGYIDFIFIDNHNLSNCENLQSSILYSQLIFIISTQKLNGNLIINLFDIFSKFSIDILYLLSLLYEQVFIVKPLTSYYIKSEKYIVCKKFRLDNIEYKDKIITKMFNILKMINNNSKDIENIINFDIPCYFLNKIEEYNAIICQEQIQHIFNILNSIYEKKQINNVSYHNIPQCIEWCKKNKLPYNKIKIT